MTPKDKAKELVDEFGHLDEECEIVEGFEFGRKCALIAIKEILLAVEGKYDEYWNNVKDEVNAL